MKVVLISLYELGRQPFGLASPAAFLKHRGHSVTCADLAVGSLPSLEVREAGLVAFYLPMHTAARLAGDAIARVRKLNPHAHLCCYGLYAPLSREVLQKAGVATILGGEWEEDLAGLADLLAEGRIPASENSISLKRLAFLPPDRSGLPGLSRYPKLITSEGKRWAGYTEASRGCKHKCRHCPVVPVYNGVFRVVPVNVVLEDIRQQVMAGAEHISFGDPDFLNGPGHAIRVIRGLHEEFPRLTYDVTCKVEHLLRHSDILPEFKRTGCLFVTTAVESLDDAVLEQLEKGHTREDFLRVAGLFERTGLTISPTFIPFTPWTTAESYRQLLRAIADLNLIGNVSPVQLTLRLLIPSGSRMLELEDIRSVTQAFDPSALIWRWNHRNPQVDRLAAESLKVVNDGVRAGQSRQQIFARLWELASGERYVEDPGLMPRTTIPYMEEPWFC